MLKNKFDAAQLFLRLALGIGFLLPVLDRFGFLGPEGAAGNAWGNWENFVTYTHSLMPFLGKGIAEVRAALATFGEVLFGILLIVGYKTRLAAMGSFLLTLCFALSMFAFAGPRIPFNYSVFVVSAASLLLAAVPVYKWSADGGKA